MHSNLQLSPSPITWAPGSRPILSPDFTYGTLATPIPGPTNALAGQTYSGGTLVLDNSGAEPFAGGGLVFPHALPAGSAFRMTGNLISATGATPWEMQLKMGPGTSGFFGIIPRVMAPASFDFIAVAPADCPYLFWTLNGGSDPTVWTIENFRIFILGSTPIP